jgi:FkbH-like protein
MSKKGVILGLNSKNNEEDVLLFLNSKNDTIIKKEHIIISKINWNNKVENLKEIAEELNIGLDSFIFIDDSDFEINLIRSHLPMVKVLKVPKNLSEYPMIIRKLENFYFKKNLTSDDLNRNESYKQNILRSTNEKQFTDIESYLKSLDLNITLHINNQKLVKRLAQMTQKTNQFNLTTKRYSESDILELTTNKKNIVYAIDVNDKYGKMGITGLSIVNIENEECAVIDSFLMSCRILGRNIEYKFLNEIKNNLKLIKIKKIHASYISTKKNIQTENFYEKNKFSLIESGESKKYVISLNDNSTEEIDRFEYIKLLKNGK